MSRALLALALLAVACSRDERGAEGSSDAALEEAGRGDGRGDDGGANWWTTGRDAHNTRFSPLAQVDTANVARLRVAWTFHTGDAPPARSEMQATPVVVDGVLFATTPALAVVALKADSGTLVWRFDPWAGREAEPSANRGVAYWKGAGDTARVFFTAGTRLYALDARTGKPASAFGDSGWVDLAQGLDRDPSLRSGQALQGWVLATSPGMVFEDLLIQGTRVGEGEGSAPGHVRAFDVRTGAIRWTFRTIPRPGEHGHDTWPDSAWRTAGGANSWPGLSLDPRRGIAYVPTGSATPDFYGGQRIGANLFANSLVALDARTGERRWHYQLVHHDLWDRDLPAAPNLVTVVREGRRVDAVAQITKHGYVFLFGRATGAPLFPIEERPAPPSDLEGERAWATQPLPTKPAPFARQAITVESLTTLTREAAQAARTRFRTLRTGLWQPPSREGTVVFPGFDGGGEWGGAAVDVRTGVLYVNASDVPWIARMREVPVAPTSASAVRSGAAVYAAACATCHDASRRGTADRVSSLVDVGARLSDAQVLQVVERGRGFMPGFAHLPEPEKRAVVAYVRGENAPVVTAPAPAGGGSSHDADGERRAASRARRNRAPYEFVGYERWRDSSGYPAVKPPWGTLSAIDLNTGEYRWRIVLG